LNPSGGACGLQLFRLATLKVPPVVALIDLTTAKCGKNRAGRREAGEGIIVRGDSRVDSARALRGRGAEEEKRKEGSGKADKQATSEF